MQQDLTMAVADEWIDVESPSRIQFEKLQAQVQGLATSMEYIEQQVRDLSITVVQKADQDQVRMIPALLQQLVAASEQKPNRTEVPTIQQIQQLTTAIEGKVPREEAPTYEYVQELIVGIEQHAKANTAELLSEHTSLLEQKMQELSDTIENMVLSNESPFAKANELAHVVDQKADRSDVPTNLQLRDLTDATRRLQNTVDTKASMDQVREFMLESLKHIDFLDTCPPIDKCGSGSLWGKLKSSISIGHGRQTISGRGVNGYPTAV
jgi:hypothetical protein